MIYVWMGLIQILYVALNSLRVVLMIRGRKLLATLISTAEVFVYICGLSIVLNNLQSPLGIVVYSLTFGVGVLLGTYLEQRIALGYISLQVITDCERDLATPLRQRGFGVTVWTGYGADGARQMLFILAPRKSFSGLLADIRQLDPDAFIVSFDASHVAGGYWRRHAGIG
ncbi:DUF2179 domain-containing protein [Brevibacillus sp. SYP-B805]|uniref:DUF2179 domain-containing protein n=1 Tax=Brevibacillus sp. SYP-B805 TaxID=1578199 RepID=UPI0013EDFD3B|nr:DUF5698 domain-containing protein [Brevibacillus sp. SYP-B805]NGQ94847.1 DUF2179 domain-containing protein [Brevibacillus sp. SYP-B805]